MEMNKNIFESIINTSQDCVFWKDKERRFVGVNQAFLDFYGFVSADGLIGKTDEDVGWHNDPVPFMQDELRVLDGESTYKIHGKCMVRDQERDIIASKRPLYDNGEIVGLAGSFLDVTETLRRRTEFDNAQTMYSIDQLRRYQYFDKLLDEISISEVLDHLTGIISRAYILDFAKSLIASETPFTFIIFDLDNFKFINDNYGHHAGDCVLMNIAESLVRFVDGYGVVGRFGGDELLIIDLRDIEFDDKKRFFRELYRNSGIVRRNIRVGEDVVYITGTSGCATYPYDAHSFDDLFSHTDKTLYNGKSIGRNCYTIYEENKHKDLDINKISGHDIYTSMNIIADIMEADAVLETRLEQVMPLLREELHITDLYFRSESGCLHSVSDKAMRINTDDMMNVMHGDLYSANNLDEIRSASPLLYGFLDGRKAEAPLIVRIGSVSETFGYLMCAEPRIKRIWQDRECGILYFLAKQLTAGIKYRGDRLPE